MPRILLAVFTFAAFLGFSLALACAGDLQAQAAKQKVAAEKLTGQVRDAIGDSRKMEPTQAKILLQTMLRQVRDAQFLLDGQRTALVRDLNARLNQVSETDRGVKVGQDQKQYGDPPKKKFTIPTSDRPGGGGVSGFAKDFTGGIKGAQKSNADLIREREKANVAINRGIEESAVPGDKEINFPRNWKQISERRKEMVSQKMTPKEVALLRTLNSTLSVNYDRTGLEAVINHLQDRTGLGIIIDEGSLRDLNIDYKDAPVTFKAEKVSVRTALKKVLGDVGLTYIIKEGNIQVMTPKKASEYTVIRTYPIGDLITPVQSNMMFGPFMQQAQKQQNAQQVINLIVFMTGQDYWQPNGPGSIAYFAPSDSLLIRASAEMHYQLASPGLFGR